MIFVFYEQRTGIATPHARGSNLKINKYNIYIYKGRWRVGTLTPKALRRCQVVEMCEDEELRFYIARNLCKMS